MRFTVGQQADEYPALAVQRSLRLKAKVIYPGERTAKIKVLSKFKKW
ncbi:hypothetical protein WDW86_18925 [Bdellovibrionota bacterium FG-2]